MKYVPILQSLIFFLVTSLLASAHARAPGPLDISFSLNTWELNQDSHSGYGLSVFWRAAEQHRLGYRHTEMNNEFSNALRATREILVCATTLWQHSSCDDSEQEYHYWREQALLYQYRFAGHEREGRRTEFWLGAGPAQVRQEVRIYDKDQERRRTISSRDNTGLAWSLDGIARGQRAFFGAAIAGNNRGRGVGLNISLGVNF